ncbi:acyl-CoA dehydrogenase C-terminal domain-containing protein, partial [Acinetobacter baumannii]
GGAFIAEYITEIRDFANDLDTDLNFIKDATLDAATEIEAITQFIIEQAAENVEFPNSAAVDYLHAVGLLSFSYMFAKIAAAAKDKSGDFYQ